MLYIQQMNLLVDRKKKKRNSLYKNRLVIKYPDKINILS